MTGTGPTILCGADPARRRGSIYLLALGVSMLVTLIGLTALMKVRATQALARQVGERSAAQALALSGVEHALAVIDATPDWRAQFTSGVEAAKHDLGQGTFAWKLVDEIDGDLANDETQQVRLQGVGRAGGAVQMYSVQVMPKKTPLSCLEASLHSGGATSFNGADVQADRLVSSNANVNAANSTINTPVEAVTTITGITYLKGTTTGVAPRQMPDPAGVFDYYLQNGTDIPMSKIPLDSSGSGSGSATLEKVALGPRLNPYGLTNVEGIYVIRCNGAPLVIRNCRIVGTLVLLEPGTGSAIEGSVRWEPEVPTLPVLMVRGSLDIRMSSATLAENTQGTNFNPLGMPYEGIEDNDVGDSFPSLITGLVYMRDKMINSTNGVYVDGMIVSGLTTNISGRMRLTYRRSIYDDAPPGFYLRNKVEAVPGSWRQDVDP